MNRQDLQILSRIRIQEARTLFENGHHAGAYYLTGYAVECALKAAIAHQVHQYDFPDKSLAQKSFSHDLGELLKLAGLSSQLDSETRSSPNFAAYWAVVKDWSVESRYDPKITVVKANNIF